MNPIERTKFMDAREVKQLRAISEGLALADLRKGRQGAVIRWAVVDVALKTGLRVSELARLRCGDIDLGRGFIKVTRSKKRHTKLEVLALEAGLIQHLKEFLAWKETAGQGTKPADALFAGKRGPLTRRGLQQLYKVAVRKAGLPEELSIHGARHTLAVHLLKKTANLRFVQKQLGHTSPTTTANLYADIAFEDMQAGLNGLYADEERT